MASVVRVGSRAESVAGEPICSDVDFDYVDELPKVDKTFKKTHKRDESRRAKKFFVTFHNLTFSTYIHM
jgi:hypothetical protein